MLERDPHTIGRWLGAFGEVGPAVLIFEQSGGSPRPRRGAAGGIEGDGAGTAHYVGHRLGQLELVSRVAVCPRTLRHQPELSSCLNCLHRLGFAFKRPKKRLLKVAAEKRYAFVAEYASLKSQAQEFGAKIFFADEAHFREDAELRCKWVLKGQPVLVDSDQPAVRREGQLLLCGVPGDR